MLALPVLRTLGTRFVLCLHCNGKITQEKLNFKLLGLVLRNGGVCCSKFRYEQQGGVFKYFNLLSFLSQKIKNPGRVAK